jgi:SPP1 family phage portal protein
MELEQLQELLGDFSKLQQEIVAAVPVIEYDILCKQYNTRDHSILDLTKRPDKRIMIPDPNSEDEEKLIADYISANRIPIPLQQLIVNRSASFLCGNPIQLKANAKAGAEAGLVEVIQKTWDDNKLDYESKRLAKLMMAETEVAELWYAEEVDKDYWVGTANAGKLLRWRMKILARKYGDRLYPVYNSTGDLILFARGYDVQSLPGQKQEHFDVYTAEKTYYGVKTGASWKVDPEDNIAKKIQVIYWQQEDVEWADQQWMIERLEKLRSNHSDDNDYDGSRITVIQGKVLGFARKGESGKLLEVEPGADVKQLPGAGIPESVKMEEDALKYWIYATSQTPDISFESMKSIAGHAPSGTALELMFMDAHMKASDKEEIFGKGIQRRINFLKAAMGKTNPTLNVPLSIKPKFEYYKPKNFTEMVDVLRSATGGKPIMSQETAVKQNLLVENGQEEFDKLTAEAESEAAALNVP